MITTTELADTIRQATGESRPETIDRINHAAQRLSISPAEGHGLDYDGDVWHDDDADEICLAILP